MLKPINQKNVEAVFPKTPVVFFGSACALQWKNSYEYMRFSSSPQFISVVCYDKIRSWNRATLIALKGKKWGEVWLKITFGLNIFSAASLFATNCRTVKDARTSFLEWGVHRARLSHLSLCGQDTESKYGGARLLFFVQVFMAPVFWENL